MYQGIVFGIAAVLCAGILLLFKGRDKEKFNTVLKALAVAFYAVGFFRFFLSDSFIYVINGGWFESVKHENHDFLQSILRWGFSINYAVLPVAVFLRNQTYNRSLIRVQPNRISPHPFFKLW